MGDYINPGKLQPKASRPYMPGYGILPADQGSGLLPWNWAVERLAKARNYLVSSIRPDGSPHTMPVWGVWLDEGFCFSTGAKSQKGRNLAANPHCTVAIDKADETIVVMGVVEVKTDPDLARRFLAAYGPKYDWNPEGFTDPIYVVRPQTVFAFNAVGEEFIGSATRWIF